MAIGIIGMGSHVPETVITNADISAWTGAEESWVGDRTGIYERRYAADGTATSDLALPAAAQALDSVPDARQRLGAIIVATCTPDVPQPATAAILQHKLQLGSVPSFDVNAVCSGFLYGLTLAEGLLASRCKDRHVLVVGADMFSRLMDRTDRRTVSLFGDGAGAALVAEVPDGYGLLAHRWQTDGDLYEFVGVEGGGTRLPLDAQALAEGRQYFRMNGRAVRTYALSTLRKLVEEVLGDAALTVDDVDRFVIHQANTRMVEEVARDLGVGLDRFAFTAPGLGNTAAASVPLTLHASHRERPIRRGERILLAAVGGGLAGGAALLRWY
ncbi:3-oxoacyl-ACP synthase III family protein [Streptomyces roseochromogenus]|uniref:3-oxoacyl-ACP synthase n=1 Tax=Streptomyces roseochromogenus subsp. oscitans DS 12.976 TaxID=1352936 RepID=V6KQ54_STRRC|nr:ketoacyl-ACP synthase III [Streptomyces roseochromogenus]EST34212.1 hypothetical protein M878_11260 [Streptomyces roseochromogenus subsp. oscitans DS 12.976]